MKTGRILLCSGNKDKFEELHSKLSGHLETELISPTRFGITLEIDEDGGTLQENAELKAAAYFNLLRIPAIADDTGLFVNSLNGAPGVYSARYSGPNATYGSNRKKLLEALKGKQDRSAEFKTVLCFVVSENEKFFFEGACKGRIAEEEKGDKGFGYDSLFLPDGYEITFAEMSSELKNSISHRGKALDGFISFLEKKELPGTP
jgi:XTP/dITP diphosphohydrolase